MHDQKMECWTVLQRRKNWNRREKITSIKGKRWNKTVNSWQFHDILSRGKPKHRWHDVITDFLGKATGRVHGENDWHKTAASKSGWMSMATDLENEF